MQQQAEADITDGASVLVIDPLDSGLRRGIEANAEPQGVKVIDYDRLDAGRHARPQLRELQQRRRRQADRQGPRRLHVRMERDEAAGTRDGRRLRPTTTPRCSRRATTRCSTRSSRTAPTSRSPSPPARGITHGADELRAAVHRPLQHQRGRHANDDIANAVISVLQKNKIPAKTFPTTGQDASPSGPAEHPEGIPVRDRVQADLPRGAGRRRAGDVPARRRRRHRQPGERHDQGHNRRRRHQVGLHTPIWVTADNMADTVVKDGAVKVSDLCTGSPRQRLPAAGIS